MANGIHNHSNLENAVLYTLAYFDVFQHPLTLEELVAFCPMVVAEDVVQEVVNELVKQKQVFHFDGMYALSPEEEHVGERKKINALAAEMIPKARQYGQLIHQFPFIKAVSISGSLSKGVFKEDDDFDYFIITAKNRIWLSRLLLKVYKLLWLKNSRSFFCINYFMSENDLEIKEKNQFTAIELITLIPITNPGLFQEIKAKNDWIKDFLPNGKWNELPKPASAKPLWAKVTEKLCWGPIGDLGDYAVMQVMKWRHRVKYKPYVAQKDFEHMFKSTRTESKIHPLNMSKKIQDEHLKKLSTLQIESI